MRYDLEGHTFDCKQCGEEHKQFHPKHIYCCLVCMWKYQDTPTEQKTCKDCGSRSVRVRTTHAPHVDYSSTIQRELT